MTWSWVQPGLLYWLKCHLFHAPSRWENYCTGARGGERPSTTVCSLPCDLMLCAHLVDTICTGKKLWVFRFHCACTNQLIRMWTYKGKKSLPHMATQFVHLATHRKRCRKDCRCKIKLWKPSPAAPKVQSTVPVCSICLTRCQYLK